jgi:hypothetical protein
MSSRVFPCPSALSLVLAAAACSLPLGLPARDLLVDQRGSAEFKTLRDAAAVAAPGDTIIIAKHSGPYRETLRIRASGTADAPITVEGNGETITGFTTLHGFQRSGSTWTCRLPKPFPLLITFQGKRILQDHATGKLLGPVKLLEDGQTIELTPGTPIGGWEISTLPCAVQIYNTSHQVYRNIVATGALNDGFNLHGKGTGLRFENITGAQNFDEGFSAHDEIECSIKNGDFWGNDNGLCNVGRSVVQAENLRCHDNLGFGFFLAGEARGELVRVDAWNNGASQVRFDRQTSGTCQDVRAWARPTTDRPWVAYQESASLKTAPTLGSVAENPDPSLWTGRPEVSRQPVPDSGSLSRPLPPAGTSASADISTLIHNAVAAGKTQLRLPSGVVRLDRTIELKGINNLEIDGTGTTLVMTARQAIFRFSECSGLTIRGFTLDYDPLPFTQATITRADDLTLEFDVHDGYPDLTTEYQGAPAHFFSANGTRQPGSYDFNQFQLEILSPRHGRARLKKPLPATLMPGDLLAMDLRKSGGTAVEIRNCSGPVTLEDVTLQSSPSLCFIGRYCEGLVTFRRVAIRPGAAPAGATHPRLLSSNADGVNFVQCRRGPVLEHCDFSGMGDDSMNVHGFLFPIVRVLSPTRFLAAYKYGPGGFTTPMHAGDVVRFYDSGNFAPSTQSALKAITPLKSPGDVTAAEVTSLFPNYNSDIYTVYQVDLTSPVAVKPGQWFDMPAMNCPGFVVRDSYFHDHRGRGLRIMANDGLVENNRFERITKSAISIGPELGYWREAGWVENVRVAGNTLRDIGVDYSLAAEGSYVPGAIGIFVRTENSTPPYPAGNRSILIENNRIENSSAAGIHGYAVSDVTVRNNTLINTNTSRPAGHTDPVTHLVTTGPISLQGVDGAVIEDNHFIHPVTTLATDTH